MTSSYCYHQRKTELWSLGTSILLRIWRWPKQEGPRKSAWRVGILFKRRIVIWFSSALQYIQLVLIYVCWWPISPSRAKHKITEFEEYPLCWYVRTN